MKEPWFPDQLRGPALVGAVANGVSSLVQSFQGNVEAAALWLIVGLLWLILLRMAPR